MLVSQEKYKKTDFFSFALQREKELERESRKEKGKVIHLKYYKHLFYALIMKNYLQKRFQKYSVLSNNPDGPLCKDSYEFL